MFCRRRIVARLDAGETHIADRHERVAVLISRLRRLHPERRAAQRRGAGRASSTTLFTAFDDACAARGVEKIKTIGDAYMAVAGLDRADQADSGNRWPRRPTSRLDMFDALRAAGSRWQMRIGIHAGPVVAGVIGTRKFAYDVWGDTVNVASRLESTSVPGRTQVSPAVADALEGRFVLEERGLVDLKGQRRDADVAPRRAGRERPALNCRQWPRRSPTTRRSPAPTACARPTSGALSALARADVRRDRRPGRRRRDAAQRRPAGPVCARPAVRGPRGTGKTSTARILAKAVNCPTSIDGEPDDTCPTCVAIREGRALDVVELDAASNNRVDDMRELLPRVYTAAADLRRKVFIIDEVQRIKEGWDVLLKTLEEPPDRRALHLLHHGPVGHPPGGRVAPPALHLPAPARGADRGQAAAHPGGRGRDRQRRSHRAHRPAARRAACATPNRCSTRSLERRRSRSTRTRCATCSAWPTSRRVDRFVDALAGGDALDGIRLLDQLEAEGRDLVAFAEQVVARLREQLVERARRAVIGRPADPPDWRALPDASPASMPAAAASGGYRWQLELALLDADHRPGTDRDRASPAPRPVGTACARRGASDLPHDRPRRSSRPRRSRRADPGRAGSRAASAPVPDAHARGHSAHDRRVAAGLASPTSGRSRRRADRRRLGAVAWRWPEIVARIGTNPANKPLDRDCRPVEVRDGDLVLGLPGEPAFLRENAERKRRCSRTAIGHVLGRPVAVRCVVANIELAERRRRRGSTSSHRRAASSTASFDLVDSRRSRRTDRRAAGRDHGLRQPRQRWRSRCRPTWPASQAELDELTVEGTRRRRRRQGGRDRQAGVVSVTIDPGSSTPTTSRCSRTSCSPPSATRSTRSKEVAEEKMGARHRRPPDPGLLGRSVA